MSNNRTGQILFNRHIDENILLGQAKGTGIPIQRFYQYDVIINRAARYYQIDPLFVKAILLVESNLNANAVSKANARGIAQFMRTTADAIGIDNRHDPITSIWGCAALLRRHCDRFNGNMILMAAAYNAGPEAIKRARGRIPHFSETEHYVPKVLWTWERMHRYHQ
jgi:soluble lytic murein transglycosylase-like protein